VSLLRPKRRMQIAKMPRMAAFAAPACLGLSSPRLHLRQQSPVRLTRPRAARCRMAASEKASPEFAAPLAVEPTDVWEIDFYSRPVVGADGKKLWEMIVTDSSGVLEHVETIPNSMVNSKELRARFQEVMAAERVKPKVVRYFRTQMVNMIRIALEDIEGLTLRPSRRCYALFNVLDDREANVYPKMPGFRKNMRVDNALLNVREPERMPDALLGEKYAFVEMQLSQFGDLKDENIGFGELCPVNPDFDESTVVPGMVIFSRRAKAISGWITGIELAAVGTNLAKRQIVIECGLDKQYLFAKLNDSQRKEAKNFSDRKEDLKGLHFLAVQQSDGDEDIQGFWLLRDVSL